MRQGVYSKYLEKGVFLLVLVLLLLPIAIASLPYPNPIAKNCAGMNQDLLRVVNLPPGETRCLEDLSGSQIGCATVNECGIWAYNIRNVASGSYVIPNCGGSSCTVTIGSGNCPVVCSGSEDMCTNPLCSGDNVCYQGACVAKSSLGESSPFGDGPKISWQWLDENGNPIMHSDCHGESVNVNMHTINLLDIPQCAMDAVDNLDKLKIKIFWTEGTGPNSTFYGDYDSYGENINFISQPNSAFPFFGNYGNISISPLGFSYSNDFDCTNPPSGIVPIGCCGDQPPNSSVTNGDFKQGIFHWGREDLQTPYLVTGIDLCHSDHYCVKAVYMNWGMQQKLDLEPDTKYTLSYWTKAGTLNGTRVAIGCPNDDNFGWTGATYTSCEGAAGTEWTRVECNFTSPAITTGQFEPTMFVMTGGGDAPLDPTKYTYVDDIQIIGPAGDLGYIGGASDEWLCADSNAYMKYDGRETVADCPSYEYGVLRDDSGTCAEYSDEWSWEDAASDYNPFRIMTFNQTETMIYDVISSGNKWVRCDPTGAFEFPDAMGDLVTLQEIDDGYLDGDEVLDPADMGEDGNDDGGFDINVGGFDTGLTGGGAGEEVASNPNPEIIKISSSEISKVHRSVITIRGVRGFVDGSFGGAGAGIRIRDNDGNTWGANPNVQIVDGKFDRIAVQVGPVTIDDNYLDIVVTYKNSTNQLHEVVYPDAILVLDVAIEPDQHMSTRFICYDEGGRGSIGECVGHSFSFSENSLFNIKANPYPKVFRSGEMLHTLYDFYEQDDPELYPARNSFKLVGEISLNNNDEWQRFFPQNKDDPALRIQNWRNYDTLEFDIYFTSTDKIKLAIFSKDSLKSASANLNDYRKGGDLADQYLFDEYIADYSVDGNELFKWHHVVIDFDDDELDADFTKDIGLLKFYFDHNEVEDDLMSKWQITNPVTAVLNGVETQVATLIGIDRIFLSRDSEDTTICSGGRKWIDNFNDYNACEDSVAYGFVADTSLETSGLCCGDDHALGSPEYFQSSSGGSGACWNGYAMGKGIAFSNIEILLNGVPFTFTCTGSNQLEQSDGTCVYPVPRQIESEVILLDNPNPGVYSAHWGHAIGNEFETFDNRVTHDPNRLIVVQLKKKEIIVDEGKYWGCWASGYEANRLDADKNFQEVCVVKAGHFCSPNQGWVPYDGSAVDLYPKNAPPGANLIVNGGFEEQ